MVRRRLELGGAGLREEEAADSHRPVLQVARAEAEAALGRRLQRDCRGRQREDRGRGRGRGKGKDMGRGRGKDRVDCRTAQQLQRKSWEQVVAKPRLLAVQSYEVGWKKVVGGRVGAAAEVVWKQGEEQRQAPVQRLWCWC